MRENWDFVSMDSYRSDTAELVAQSTGIIKSQADRIRDLEHLIWAIAKSAGGRVTVHGGLLAERPKPGQLAFWRCDADDTLRIDAQ